MFCHIKYHKPSLVEEAIINYDNLPPYMKHWRCFRIEYGFECSCPEGYIFLPPSINPEQIENLFP